MKTASVIAVSIVSVCLGISAAMAQSPGELFARGNEDYRAGKYDAAASQYQDIIKQGLASAEVYFNLGNAFYRAGKIAPAILAYERAQRLKPGDPDIAHNLQLVDFKTIDRIEPVPELFVVQWLRAYAAIMPFTTAFRVMMAGWIVFFVALAGIYVTRSARLVRILRWLVLLSVVAMVLSGGTVAIHSVLSRGNDQAIIMAPVVTAKSSPDEQSINAFVVHEGLKVKMSDTLGDWVKITLADGKVGWIHTDQCERI